MNDTNPADDHGLGAYVRRVYGVTARRGMRVIADGKPGVITSFAGARLRIRLDGETRPGVWHPTWRITYLADDGPVTTED